MRSERIRFDIQTRKPKRFFNENDWEVIWRPKFCPTKSRTLCGTSRVSRLMVWRLFGIGTGSQAGCCSREYWMSKYCMFEQRKQTTKKPPKNNKTKKHLKPSLSIATYRKEMLFVPLVFSDAPCCCRVFCVQDASCHRLALRFKTTQKKETVLTTARAAAGESTANKGRYCCVQVLK